MPSTASVTAKVIVLTGASSGIGEATARHLARQGHHLHICARRLDRLTALQDEMRAEGCHVEAVRWMSRASMICKPSSPRYMPRMAALMCSSTTLVSCRYRHWRL